MAWYFKQNIFYPQGIPLIFSRDFVSLPDNQLVTVSPNTINARTNLLPLSMLASAIQGIKFKFEIPKAIGYYDIETDKTGNIFKFGYVNNQLFNDPSDMLEDLHRYKMRVAYNSFRFDNPVLYNNAMNIDKYMGTYDLRKFLVHYIRNGINLDLLFFVRLLGFNNLRMYAVARELGINYKPTREFNEAKCIQDVTIMQDMFDKLHIEQVCTALNDLVSMDLNLLQNVYFDRFLRYILLQHYLNDGYLPVAYPRKMPLNKDTYENLLKIGLKGEYKGVLSFDVNNAYPTTASKLKLGVYDGEVIISSLEAKLIKLMIYKPEAKRGLKKIAVALIGYMNDKTNYFSNPSVWKMVIETFNNTMLDATKGLNMVWANTDGFMIKEDPKYTDKDIRQVTEYLKSFGYELNLEEDYKYIKIYNPNKYIGVTSDGIVVMKGITYGNIDGLYEITLRLKTELQKTLDLDEALNNLKINDILVNDELWTLTVKKTNDECRKEDFLEIWEDLEIGFNDVVLTKQQRTDKVYDWKRQFG